MKRFLWLGIPVIVLLVLWAFSALRREHTYTLSVSWPRLTEKSSVALRLVKKKDPDSIVAESNGEAGRGLFTTLNKSISPSSLAVQVKTPEGWTDCSFKRETHREGSHSFRLRAGMVRLWIDNLDGDATEITCGSFRFPVAAKAKREAVFPSPLVKAVPLMMGEKQIGEIPPLELKDKDTLLTDVGYLVDCSGGRSYTHTAVAYQGKKGLPQQFSLSDSTQQLSGKHIHKLRSDRVDYFLTPAPKTIEVKTFGPTIMQEQQYRYEILHE